MKTSLTILALSASALAVPSAAIAQRAPAAVIVVVDSDRIYRDCTACKTAQTQLQSRLTGLQTRQQTLPTTAPWGKAIQAAIQALGSKAPECRAPHTR